MTTLYYQRPRITALAALLSLYLASPALQAQSNLNEDYRIRYSLDKVDISENTQQQAEGRFELRGITAASSSTTSLTTVKSKSAISTTIPTTKAENTAILLKPKLARKTDTTLQLAQAFLNDNRELLGITSAATDLRLNTRKTDRFGRQHLRYRRMVGPLQLKDMEVILHVSDNGKVSGLNGNIVRIGNDLAAEIQFLQSLNTLPKLTDSLLLDLAAQYLKADISQLKLHSSQAFATNTSPYVIWQIEVSRPGQIGYDQLTLADTSGTVIHHKAPLRRHF